MGETLPNGIYVPDADEVDWDEELDANLVLIDDTIGAVAALEEEIETISGEPGPQGPPGKMELMFRYPGEAEAVIGSEPRPLPFDCNILEAWISTTEFAAVTPVTGDFNINGVSLWEDEGDQPVLPTGVYVGDHFVPDVTTGYLKNQIATFDIDLTGPPSTGTGSDMTVRCISDTVTSAAATKSNYNIPIPYKNLDGDPVAYHVGDILVNVLVTLTQSLDVLPDGWLEVPNPTVVEESSHPDTLHVYVFAKIAETSESATQNVVLTGGTPMLSFSFAINNPFDIDFQPDDTDTAEQGVSSDRLSLPGVTTSQDGGIIFNVYGCRFTVAGSNDLMALDEDLTTLFADFTTRTTQTNVGGGVGFIAMPFAGTTPAYEAVVPSTLPRWAGRSIALFPGAVGDSPGLNITGHLLIEEVV